MTLMENPQDSKNCIGIQFFFLGNEVMIYAVYWPQQY